MVPDAFNEVQLTVTGTTSGAMLYQQSFPLAPGAAGARVYTLPLRVGVQPKGNAVEPFRIEAPGRLNQVTVVSRSATLRFVEDQVLLLPLPLLAVCRGVTCTQPGTTCDATGTCMSDTVTPSSLPPYHPGSAGGGGAGRGGTVGGGGGTGGGSGAGGRAGSAGAGGTAGSAGVGGTAGSAGVGGTAGGAGGVGGTGGMGGLGGTGGAAGNGGAGASGGTGGSAGRGGVGGSTGGRGGTGGVGGNAGSGGTSGTGGRGGTGAVGGTTGGAGGRGGTGGSAGAGGVAGTGGSAGVGGGDDGGGSGGTVVVPTLNDGLIAYWAFDQSGTSYPDYSGNGNTATAPGGAWTANGEVGGALDLSGQDFTAGAQGTASINTITTAVSITAWIVPPSPGATRTLVSRYLGADYWKLGLADNGALRFTAGTHFVQSTSIVGTGTKWVHVAATYDGTTARIYVGGAMVASMSFGAVSLNGGPPGGGPGGYGPEIGGTFMDVNAVDTELFQGMIDEITIHNRPLTASEVDGLAHGALPSRH
jgi:hypothetical protein